MCKSHAQGGQRCAAHTRGPYQRTDMTDPRWDDVARNYASTPEGQTALTAAAASASRSGQFEVEARLRNALMRGQSLRDTNATLARTAKLDAAGSPTSGDDTVLSWDDASSANEDNEAFIDRYYATADALLDVSSREDDDISGYQMYIEDSGPMNAHLRGTEPDMEQIGDIARLDRTIVSRGITETQPMTVFRGIDRSDDGTFDPSTVHAGDTIHEPAFLSTAYTARAAEPYGEWTYRIEIPSSTPFLPGNGGHGDAAENELIFQRGGHLAITAVDRENCRITATFLPPTTTPPIPGD